jgi:GAF domain-containing protein
MGGKRVRSCTLAQWPTALYCHALALDLQSRSIVATMRLILWCLPVVEYVEKTAHLDVEAMSRRIPGAHQVLWSVSQSGILVMHTGEERLMSTHDHSEARERWYGTQDAARFLGIHRSTLHLAVRQGQIAPTGYTPGGHARFSIRALEAFQASLAERPATGDTSLHTMLRELITLTDLLPDSVSPEHVAEASITCLLRALSGVHMACVMVRSRTSADQLRMRPLAQRGYPDEALDDFVRLQATFRYVTRIALRTGEPQICEDTARATLQPGTARLCRTAEQAAYAIMPILRGDQALGALICGSRHPRRFTTTELAWMRAVAAQLAVVLQHSLRYGALQLDVSAADLILREAWALQNTSLAGAGNPRVALLAQRFRALTGALRVCVLGFGDDVPGNDAALQALVQRAREGDAVLRQQWAHRGRIHSAVAISLPHMDGARPAVGALWEGERSAPEADQMVLVTFASACRLVCGELVTGVLPLPAGGQQ